MYPTSTSDAWKDLLVSLWVHLLVFYVTFLALFGAPAGSEGRRRSREEEEEEALKRKQLQEEHLSKVSKTIISAIAANVNARCLCVRANDSSWEVYECMRLCADSVWFGKAHSEGGDGKRADQRASRT